MIKRHMLAQAISAICSEYISVMPRERTKEDIDIEAEYELIQQKKSKLSARKRAWIVSRYEAQQKEPCIYIEE